MANQLPDEEIRKIAKERIQARRGFYTHLTIYIAVNILLTCIWWFTNANRGYFWPGWVMLGWGIGIIANAVAVFRRNDIIREQREIEKEVEKIKSGK